MANRVPTRKVHSATSQRADTEGDFKFCEGCGKKIHKTAKSCPFCGYTAKQTDEFGTTQTLAIVGLILNAIVLPGLGTIVGGQTKKGILQLVLFLISIPLIFVIIGIPMIIGIWVWALVTSIQQLQKFD